MESPSSRRRTAAPAKARGKAEPHRSNGNGNGQASRAEPQGTAAVHAWSEQFLAREKAILEMIARGRPVAAVLEALTRSVEAEIEGLLCAVLVVDRDGKRLRHGAAPGLPDAWRAAVDGVPIGPGDTPCSRAAFTAERVVVEDLCSDPLWAERRELAERLGLRGCCSVPVLSGEKTVLGTFALYYREPRLPAERDLAMIDRVQNLAGIVLERSRAEDALRESEERFRSLSKLSSDWYWEQDENFRFTKMSDGLLGRTGRIPAAAHIGKTRWQLPTLNMTHADWVQHIALLEAHKPFYDFEICRPDVDGNPRYATVSGEPIFDEAGDFRGYRGVGKDITARKREEEILRLEHSVARSLAEAESASAGLRAVIRAVCETEMWDCGRYWRVDEADDVLRFGDAWGPPIGPTQELIEASRDFVFRRGEGFSGQVWATGEPLWIADVGTDPRAMYRESFAKAGIRAAFVFPVTAEAKTIGMIGMSCSRVRAPDERLLQAVRVIGSQVGQFLKRKHTEEALRDSEERFRSLTELSSDWYWEQDESFRFTSSTGRGGAGSTLDFAAARGKTRWELGHEIVSGGDWDRHRATLEAHLPFFDLELKGVRADGHEFFIATSGRPVFGAGGKFRGYRGVGRDITARKRAEYLLRLEHTVARCLAEAEGVSAALKTVIQATCETQRLECGVYWSLDDAGDVMVFGESWSAPGGSIEALDKASPVGTFRRGEGLVGVVWESRMPLWIPDATRDPRVKRPDLVGGVGVHGVFLFPVVSEGQVIGVFDFSSRTVREPDQRLLEAARVIGSQIGQFVHRKRAEQVLRESEERFRSLTELSSDWYWEQDAQFRFVTVAGNTMSPAMRLIGKTRWALEGADADDPAWKAHRDTLEAHQPFRDFVRPGRNDRGEIRYLSVSGEPVFGERGEFRGYRGTGKDVTESMRREEDLRRFRASMDLSADMIFLIDRETMRFIDMNETACRSLGYSREELLGMGPQDLLPITRDSLERAYDDMIRTGIMHSGMRSHYRRKDGSLLPFESTRRVMRSADRWTVVVISRDTSERIAAEEALRRSNERFNLAVRATNDVIWDWNLVTDELWWNDNLSKVFGYARDDVEPTNRFWYGNIHPDDRDRVETGLAQLIDTDGANWSDEYRFRRADGSYAHVFDRGHVVYDEHGRPVRMIGALADITGRKETEETVRSQALQQRLIAEFGQQALASADLEDVLNHAVELVSVTLKVDYCEVLELNADGKALTYRAASGWPHEWVGRRVVQVRAGGALAHVLSSREPVVIEDHAAETRFPASPLMQFGVRSGMQVPILGSQGAYGVLGVHRFTVHRFSRDDASFLQSVANILAVAIERKSAEEQLAHLAQFDVLTGLPNRYLFHDRLVQSIAQGTRTGRPIAILFIDLDRFKLVNDTLGHRAGDTLLAEAATRLADCVRSGDTVGRFGGDEFGAVLTDLGRPADASLVAQKIIDALSQPFQLDGQETFISASIGITIYPADGEMPESLVMNADTAMYRAKEQGRNTYQYFTREMNERALARVQMEASLRRALERGEFLMHYQPKMDLASGAISGFEALMRWQHPERGIVSPVEFIPVLEETALIIPAGEWAMREVCRQVRAWKSAGLDVPPVAVNLSARQFQHKNLDATVRRILYETGVDASLIQFELTETLLMKDPESATRTLAALKESGVAVSVDDFGQGYSSLAYLKRFPLDALKIDRAFIRDVTVDPEDAAITFAIIGLAHSLKLKVIAEGVETREQLELLFAHGCDEIQGFYFAMPASAQDCERLLRKTA